MPDQKIITIADALNHNDTAEQELLHERVDIIRHKLKFLESKPSVLCIASLQPLQAAGNLVAEMVEVAGGIPALHATGEITWDDIHISDPDIIVLMPAGLGLDATLKEVGNLLSIPVFANLKAVKNNRFYIADGNRYFYNSGATVVDSIEILAEIINPKQFIFGYEGDGWMKFQV